MGALLAASGAAAAAVRSRGASTGGLSSPTEEPGFRRGPAFARTSPASTAFPMTKRLPSSGSMTSGQPSAPVDARSGGPSDAAHVTPA
ncbi:hypothetical protein [Streptomyces sp. TP-A0356]|uniref:hypothetical protein n=1 Tax=Streptomyces sp. TP-A0356 TaxID=1359208 RepID=UPI0006E26850|nr:hypothetical protein [Streptomyces sp. TP-A0356]